MAEQTLDPLSRAASDAKLRAALASAGLTVWEFDLATRRMVSSEGAAPGPGITPGAGVQLPDTVHPDDRAAVDAALAAAYAGARPYEAEFRVTTPAGERWLRERGEVERAADGTPLRLCGVTLDITASKQDAAELTTLRDRLEGELAGMARLHELGQHLAAVEDASSALDAIVEAGVAITGAERGALQLLDLQNDRLMVVASKGFDQEFLDFFRYLRPQDAPVSGRALVHEGRVIVEDVATSPIYAGTPALDLLLAAGVRSVQSTPLLSRSGRLWGVLSTHRSVPTARSQWQLKLLDLLCGQIADFLERTEADRARRDSDERFRVLANTVPDMTWMAAADGTLIFASERWRQYCGVDPMQHARDWTEVIVHPDDRERRRAAWEEALRDGTAHEIEVRKRRHDGVYRWFLSRAAPVHGSDGGVRAWFGANTDIDDRKRMEQALREREAQLEMAVEAGRIGIWHIEPESGSAIVSEPLALMLGLPPGKKLLTATEWQRVIHPDDRDQVLASMKTAVASRSSFHIEFRITRPRGEVRWLMASGGVEREPAGRAGGRQRRVAGVVLDITERKATEERQSLLMAELDHRVRNILATIQAMVSVSGRSVASAAEYQAGLRGRIAAMAGAHSLLTRTQWQGADLADIVHNEMRAYAEAVIVRGPSGCLLGAKQALDFAMSLHELATNASKYGALSVPGGRVAIEWRVEHGDVGDGPRKDLAVRFLWRETGGPAVVKPVTKGFGSRLIERALPQVELTYDPGGVRCQVWLPIRDLRASVASPSLVTESAAAPEGRPLLAGRRVLVVEDEPLVALELKTALEAAGAEILTAGSLQAAGAHADDQLSAAVLDINLGDGMTYPVARRLLDRKLPILFATGYEARTVIPDDLKDVPVLQKPVDSARLVRLLAALLHPSA